MKIEELKVSDYWLILIKLEVRRIRYYWFSLAHAVEAVRYRIRNSLRDGITGAEAVSTPESVL